MDRGYIKLWRKIDDCEALKERGKVFSKKEAWIHMLMTMAQGVDNGEVKRGEFQASYRYLGKAWLWDVHKVYRFIKSLEAENMLSRKQISVQHPAQHLAQQEAQHFIICNYDLYNPQRNTDDNTQRNTSRNKLNKGFNKGSNEIETLAAGAAVNQAPSPAFMLAEKLRQAIATRDPESKPARNPKCARDWTPHFEKILSLDHRTVEECESVIAWCQSEHCFWGTVVMSGKKFREKFDTMRGQMKRENRLPFRDTIGKPPESHEELSPEFTALVAKRSKDFDL